MARANFYLFIKEFLAIIPYTILSVPISLYLAHATNQTIGKSFIPSTMPDFIGVIIFFNIYIIPFALALLYKIVADGVETGNREID